MRALWVGFAFFIAACQPAIETPAPKFYAETNPDTLSEWGQMTLSKGEHVLGDGVVPYTLSDPLFTDYAHKLRTIWMPEGLQAEIRSTNEVLDFPVGTVITKTFYYPKAEDGVAKIEDLQPVNRQKGLPLSSHRLMETRVLVHRKAGWEAVSYVWNEAQTEARLTRIGAVFDMTLVDDETRTEFVYAVPNQNQCAGCHMANAVDKAMQPLGPRPYFLRADYYYADGMETSLSKFFASGIVAGTAIEKDNHSSRELEELTRAYLDMNCAHCHNPKGPASTSGLHLSMDSNSLPHLGLCKPPIAAGSGTGGRQFSIVPGSPEQSILTYRMASRDPGAMMPELGRSLTHEEGVALVQDWINAMPGDCRKG